MAGQNSISIKQCLSNIFLNIESMSTINANNSTHLIVYTSN